MRRYGSFTIIRAGSTLIHYVAVEWIRADASLSRDSRRLVSITGFERVKSSNIERTCLFAQNSERIANRVRRFRQKLKECAFEWDIIAATRRPTINVAEIFFLRFVICWCFVQWYLAIWLQPDSAKSTTAVSHSVRLGFWQSDLSASV